MIIIDASKLTKKERGLLSAFCVKITPSIYATPCNMKIVKTFVNRCSDSCIIYNQIGNKILTINH